MSIWSQSNRCTTREKERRHDSVDRHLSALHTPELNQTSNQTYALRATGFRDEGSRFGEPAHLDTTSGKDDNVQDNRCCRPGQGTGGEDGVYMSR